MDLEVQHCHSPGLKDWLLRVLEALFIQGLCCCSQSMDRDFFTRLRCPQWWPKFCLLKRDPRIRMAQQVKALARTESKTLVESGWRGRTPQSCPPTFTHVPRHHTLVHKRYTLQVRINKKDPLAEGGGTQPCPVVGDQSTTATNLRPLSTKQVTG